MSQQYSSDKPIISENEDKFQRFPFAKRIAESIIESKDNNDGIVIGIYGAWGDGKTSVLNFIEAQLRDKDGFVVTKFNPWRFRDESTLLVQFFSQISKSINRKKNSFIKAKDTYITRNNISNLIDQYGDNLSHIPDGGITKSSASALAKILKTDLEAQKKKIEKKLIDNKDKIVIFIDDIDRLDKDEIYSLFRLIKLSADFPRLVYILAFDQEMVAAAIGSRYGEGNKYSGQSFLEKIVQVPLKLPVAQPNALKKYCLESIDDIFKGLDVKTLQDDRDRFAQNFHRFLLPALKTPRLSIRYTNSISFILPILKDEVNVIDLLLIEAIKIFYHPYYELIRDNKDLFTETYQIGIPTQGPFKKERFERVLNEMPTGQVPNEKKIIKEFLFALFPILYEMNQGNSFEKVDRSEWLRGKRIVSPEYFDQYFLFCVPEGNVSDKEFDRLIHSLSVQNLSDVAFDIERIIKKGSPKQFIQKLDGVSFPLAWEDTKKLTKAIALKGEFFPNANEFWGFPSTTIVDDIVLKIIGILEKSKNSGDILDLAKEIIRISKPINFPFQLFRWLGGLDREDTEDTNLFKKKELLELGQQLILNALDETKNSLLFDLPNPLGEKIFALWIEQDPENALKYINSKLNAAPEIALNFLKSFTPIGRSSQYPDPYFVNFAHGQYNYLKYGLKINMDLLFNSVEIGYPNALVGDAIFSSEFDKNESDENILRQFIYWYNIDKASPQIIAPIVEE